MVAEPVWTFDWRTEGKGLAGLTHARCVINVCGGREGAPAVCWWFLSWLGSCPHPQQGESMRGEISTLTAPSTAQFWPPCPLLLYRNTSARPGQSAWRRTLRFLNSGQWEGTRPAQRVKRRRHFPSGLIKPTPCHCATSPERPQRVGYESPQRREIKGRAGLFKARGNPPRTVFSHFSQWKRF